MECEDYSSFALQCVPLMMVLHHPCLQCDPSGALSNWKQVILMQ